MAVGLIELLIVLVVVGLGVTALIVLLVVLVPALSRRGNSALEELERRYARGEIDTEEFEQRREQLLRSLRER